MVVGVGMILAQLESQRGGGCWRTRRKRLTGQIEGRDVNARKKQQLSMVIEQQRSGWGGDAQVVREEEEGGERRGTP